MDGTHRTTTGTISRFFCTNLLRKLFFNKRSVWSTHRTHFGNMFEIFPNVVQEQSDSFWPTEVWYWLMVYISKRKKYISVKITSIPNSTESCNFLDRSVNGSSQCMYLSIVKQFLGFKNVFGLHTNCSRQENFAPPANHRDVWNKNSWNIFAFIAVAFSFQLNILQIWLQRK